VVENTPVRRNVEHAVVAVDLAKNVFEAAVSEVPGKVAFRRRLKRADLAAFLAQLPPATVLFEACGSAHHWARVVAGFGHHVVLLPPHKTRRYRAGSKTDKSDAKAMLEAFRNEDLFPVPVKSVEQQSLAFLHRLRSGWKQTRTARLNSLRGVLRELGETIPVGAERVVPETWSRLEDADSVVPLSLRPFLAELCTEIRELERRMNDVARELDRLGSDIPAVQHLLSVPGIGPLTATALVAFVGEIHRFASGRRFAAYLGLVPKEHSSGETRRLGRISKRGDCYLRMLLIHGARSVLWAAKKQPQPDRLAAWALRIEATRGHNKAAVALANKLARIAWAVWHDARNYEARSLQTAA
jgi:transposase